MNKLTQSTVLLSALLGLTASAATFAAEMGTVKIDLPAENARLKPGPGMDAAEKSCMICHSVDYIYMQPPLSKEQWQAEVVKMKKVFGAPIPDSDVDTIVNYLMSQNGKP
jgi:cytochrome c5